MMRTVRFLAGLAMVVTGVSLAAPMVTRLVEAHANAPVAGDPRGGAEATPPGAAAWAGVGLAAAPARGAAAGYCIPDPRSTVATDGAIDGDPAGPLDMRNLPTAEPSSPMPAPAYAPPPPPDVLPALPADLSLAPPPFDSTYRSTLDVPPPPLLDAAAPAPLAVSTAAHAGGALPALGPMLPAGVVHTVSVERGPVGGGVVPAQAIAGLVVAPAGAPGPTPDSYTIRDGDDLTSIAARLYGHPGAAEAIWSANRDRLTDPNVLPIGLALRIPPTWVPPAARGRGPGGEPAPIEPSPRPARVRVAPGESLESLAERFYGDRAMAARVWEANREQLRHPDLLVAGMELRLP